MGGKKTQTMKWKYTFFMTEHKTLSASYCIPLCYLSESWFLNWIELNRSVYQHHNITYLKFYFHNRCSFFEDVIFVCIYAQTNGSIQVWCIKRAISHSAYYQSSGRRKILMIVHFHIAFLFLWLQSFQPLTCLTSLQG